MGVKCGSFFCHFWYNLKNGGCIGFLGGNIHIIDEESIHAMLGRNLSDATKIEKCLKKKYTQIFSLIKFTPGWCEFIKIMWGSLGATHGDMVFLAPSHNPAPPCFLPTYLQSGHQN